MHQILVHFDGLQAVAEVRDEGLVLHLAIDCYF
jgi:hypothetical protein